jgi:hypothetical protein
MTIEIAGFVITAVIFIGTVLAAASKYGGDMQKLKSENEKQDMRLSQVEKTLEADRLHNEKQHLEFYENRNVTIELRQDMKHIMGALGDIKALLGDKRRDT